MDEFVNAKMFAKLITAVQCIKGRGHDCDEARAATGRPRQPRTLECKVEARAKASRPRDCAGAQEDYEESTERKARLRCGGLAKNPRR